MTRRKYGTTRYSYLPSLSIKCNLSGVWRLSDLSAQKTVTKIFKKEATVNIKPWKVKYVSYCCKLRQLFDFVYELCLFNEM